MITVTRDLASSLGVKIFDGSVSSMGKQLPFTITKPQILL